MMYTDPGMEIATLISTGHGSLA